MTEDTYTVEITGEQAYIIASYVSVLAKQVKRTGKDFDGEVAKLAPFAQRCAEIAEQADEWPGPSDDDPHEKGS